MDERTRAEFSSFRWQAFFQQADDALFVLDQRRRLRFANRSWEILTGFLLEQVRGLPCRRRKNLPSQPAGSSAVEAEDILAGLLTPVEGFASRHAEGDQDSRDSRPLRIRRFVPPILPYSPNRVNATGSVSARPLNLYWDVEFFPIRQKSGWAYLGRLTEYSEANTQSLPPLPDRLLSLGQRARARVDLTWLDEPTPALRRLACQVRLAATVAQPVLLVGETGVGKRTVARVIHDLGPTRDRAFVVLECGRLPTLVLARLLFDPRLESTRQMWGTLYLRQIERLPKELQSRLVTDINLLPTGETVLGPHSGFRLCAGFTNGIGESSWQEWLQTELGGVLGALVLEVAPLRQRKAELPRLVRRLLDQTTAAGEHSRNSPRELSQASWELLTGHDWPGNLRELNRVVLGAWTRAGKHGGERIEVGDFPSDLQMKHHLSSIPAPVAPKALPLDPMLEQVERRLIELTLRRAKGNKSLAAELLDINRPRLLRRLEALGIGPKNTQVEEK